MDRTRQRTTEQVAESLQITQSTDSHLLHMMSGDFSAISEHGIPYESLKPTYTHEALAIN